jgi:hypothetical protein
VPDTVFAEVNGLPKGVTATIEGNRTPNPVINIGWKTLNVPPGSYHFFVSYTDNDCPMYSRQFQAYTITTDNAARCRSERPGYALPE